MFCNSREYESYVNDSPLITLFLNWRDIKLKTTELLKDSTILPVLSYTEYMNSLLNTPLFGKYDYKKYLKNFKEDKKEVNLSEYFNSHKLRLLRGNTGTYLEAASSSDIIELLEVLDEYVDLFLFYDSCIGTRWYSMSSFNKISQKDNIKTIVLNECTMKEITINIELSNINSPITSSGNSILDSISSDSVNGNILIYTVNSCIHEKYNHTYTFISNEKFNIDDYDIEDQIVLSNVINLLSSNLLYSIKNFTYEYVYSDKLINYIRSQYKLLNNIDDDDWDDLDIVLNSIRGVPYYVQPDK